MAMKRFWKGNILSSHGLGKEVTYGPKTYSAETVSEDATYWDHYNSKNPFYIEFFHEENDSYIVQLTSIVKKDGIITSRILRPTHFIDVPQKVFDMIMEIKKNSDCGSHIFVYKYFKEHAKSIFEL